MFMHQTCIFITTQLVLNIIPVIFEVLANALVAEDSDWTRVETVADSSVSHFHRD